MEVFNNPDGTISRRNGSWCDVDDGPCSCGAWHSEDEIPIEMLLSKKAIKLRQDKLKSI